MTNYFKQINPNSPFLKKFENQRHLRRAFFEEYKVVSFNYTLLLMDSVVRILNTKNKSGFSEHYRNFLEKRGKRVGGPGVVNCVGWDHILRIIRVIEMGMRDLIYKIVPVKVVVKQLKTSKGKILHPNSKYTLEEQKKTVYVKNKQ